MSPVIFITIGAATKNGFDTLYLFLNTIPANPKGKCNGKAVSAAFVFFNANDSSTRSYQYVCLSKEKVSTNSPSALIYDFGIVFDTTSQNLSVIPSLYSNKNGDAPHSARNNDKLL